MSTGAARQALGPVRSAPRRYDPLPAAGHARDAALEQLKAVISADVVRTIDAAMAAGWHPLDHEEVADGYFSWLGRFFLAAVVDGVYSWRDAQ